MNQETRRTVSVYTYTNSEGVTKKATVRWATAAADHTLSKMLKALPQERWEGMLQEVFETITQHSNITALNIQDDGEVGLGIEPGGPVISQDVFNEELLNGLCVTYDARTPSRVGFTHRNTKARMVLVESVPLWKLAEGWESAWHKN